MKTISQWALAVLVCFPLPALAQSPAHTGHDHAIQGPTISTTGEVRAVNVAASTIKLRHEAIPALGWPAMVMDFKVKDTVLLKGLKIGDAVSFSFKAGEADYVVMAIRPR